METASSFSTQYTVHGISVKYFRIFIEFHFVHMRIDSIHTSNFEYSHYAKHWINESMILFHQILKFHRYAIIFIVDHICFVYKVRSTIRDMISLNQYQTNENAFETTILIGFCGFFLSRWIFTFTEFQLDRTISKICTKLYEIQSEMYWKCRILICQLEKCNQIFI